MNIAVIGAGQLGSRHLQALALLENPAEFFIVDPSEANRKVARERWQQIEGWEKHNLSDYNSLAEIPVSKIDVAIVATNSGVRKKVVQELLTSFQLQYLILEKFLFQHPDHYGEVAELLRQKRVKAYVNCPRRMFPAYIKLKGLLVKNTPLRMEVIGNQWGLGCNGIHFIDLFSWLCGEPELRWQDELDEGHIPSKRAGYAEFSGTLVGKTLNGSHLSLTCYQGGPPNISVRISSAQSRFIIAESLGQAWMEVVGKEQVSLSQFDYKVLFQSQLTHRCVQDLMDKGDCELTPYSESVELHLPFLKVLLEHYNKNQQQKTELCPIT